MRHTPPGTVIRVSSDAARLTVEDSGPGVPDEAMTQLFEKFYRVPGRRSSRSGTGIGLSVARGMAEAMGGQISARRSELGGLAIDLQLKPARIPAELVASAAAS